MKYIVILFCIFLIALAGFILVRAVFRGVKQKGNHCVGCPFASQCDKSSTDAKTNKT